MSIPVTKARDLRPTDIVILNGAPWTVVECSKAGKGLRKLTVTQHGVASFSKVVPAGRDFDRPVRVTEGRKVSQIRWSEPDDEVEAALMEAGGSLLGVEHSDGSFTLPRVDEATVAAHLLVFHGVTHSGVSLREARASRPDAEKTMTPEEALRLADFESAVALHDELHAAGDLPVAHVHTGKRPGGAKGDEH